MKADFGKQAKPPRAGGVLFFEGGMLRADDVDVFGNWEKPEQSVFCLKKGESINVNVNIILALQMYLAAMETGKNIEQWNFRPLNTGYGNGGKGGLIVMPDFNITILAVRADHISSLSRVKKGKKKEHIRITTTSGQNYTANWTYDKFVPAFQRASKGEHVACWPEGWMYDKPQLNRAAMEKHKICKL